jgi:hypothetical protein
MMFATSNLIGSMILCRGRGTITKKPLPDSLRDVPTLSLAKGMVGCPMLNSFVSLVLQIEVRKACAVVNSFKILPLSRSLGQGVEID